MESQASPSIMTGPVATEYPMPMNAEAHPYLHPLSHIVKRRYIHRSGGSVAAGCVVSKRDETECVSFTSIGGTSALFSGIQSCMHTSSDPLSMSLPPFFPPSDVHDPSPFMPPASNSPYGAKSPDRHARAHSAVFDSVAEVAHSGQANHGTGGDGDAFFESPSKGPPGEEANRAYGLPTATLRVPDYAYPSPNHHHHHNHHHR
uniref:Uncharacterized protein n=1 Tax=Vitrella brassicaformis TaxID=1169539 RepID=A0A7S1P8I6_9ALVE|mmetsp:Transcript_41823/g.104406  ORF Transcript_41823/g.104406 Transcript_41823/m.104406 type:complete len:203 (+) Transcript_41823:295-903(+)